jgi:hypothetical protein
MRQKHISWLRASDALRPIDGQRPPATEAAYRPLRRFRFQARLSRKAVSEMLLLGR